MMCMDRKHDGRSSSRISPWDTGFHRGRLPIIPSRSSSCRRSALVPFVRFLERLPVSARIKEKTQCTIPLAPLHRGMTIVSTLLKPRSINPRTGAGNTLGPIQLGRSVASAILWLRIWSLFAVYQFALTTDLVCLHQRRRSKSVLSAERRVNSRDTIPTAVSLDQEQRTTRMMMDQCLL